MSENLSAKYYQENKEKIQKKLVKDIKIFFNEKKKQHYGHECYKNLSENEKQKLVEYWKKYRMISFALTFESSLSTKNMKRDITKNDFECF